MKRYYLNIAAISLFAATLLTGCDDAEYKTVTHKVYFAEAAASPTKSIAVEDAETRSGITIRLDRLVSEDVTVTLEVDPTLIDKYNKVNQTTVKLLPSEHYSFDKTITIKANEVSSAPSLVTIKPFAALERYAIPLRIKSVNGPVVATSTSSSLLLLLDKPILFNCPTLKPTGTSPSMIHTGPFQEDGVTPIAKWPEPYTVSGWSLEFWVKMGGFYQNQALFDSGSYTGGASNEIYIRFGDAGAPFNWLQIKTMGTQADTAKDFVANKWYHIAFVYDGNQILIYRDGDVVAAKATKGGTILIDHMSMISSGSSWFRANCNLSEIRFWKKAISPTQIRNNRLYSVSPDNPDLIAYWKMNEGTGVNFADITGNGHDGIAKNGVLRNWLSDQRYDR